MRILITLGLLALCLSLQAQQTIKGVILSEEDNNPLPFATIITDKGEAAISNLLGEFSLSVGENTQTFTVSYVGYESVTREILPIDFFTIRLNTKEEELQPVFITQQQDLAEKLIEEAIARKTENDPDNALGSYRFNFYSKTVITANPDSISGAVDSVFAVTDQERELLRVDSTNYRLKKRLLRSHLYLAEKASEITFIKGKGKQEKVLGNRMAGLQEPLYRLLTLELQSFSFYDDTYSLFGTEYLSPLANNATKFYKYRILDTLNDRGKEAFMVYFFPRKSDKRALLEGILYLNTESYAVQKGIAELKGTIDITASQTYRYFEDEKIWFPIEQQVELGKGENDLAVSLFDRVTIETETEAPEKGVAHTNAQDASEEIRLYITEQAYDIELNSDIEKRSNNVKLVISEEAALKDDTYWNPFRTETLGSRERETYVFLDSLAKAQRLNERIPFLKKLFTGYLATRYVDFDLKYLLKYNAYEGFRTGMGAVTNENFSQRFTLNAYGVYGTLDADFKYGAGAAFRLDKMRNTIIGLNYTDDLTETGSSKFITDGRMFYVFEPRLFNISLFHRTRDISASLSHDINSKLTAKGRFSLTDVEPTYAYTYLEDGITPFNKYQASTATVALQWSPFNEYMQTPEGTELIKAGYPQLSLQATKSFKGFFESDFDFSKLQLRIKHEWQLLNSGRFTFQFNGGIASGALPVTELFHASPNQPDNEDFWRRFSVAGRDSFETMYFNEFFSDRYFSLQAKHFFLPVKLSKMITPEFVIISRFAMGDIDNLSYHQGLDFQSLNKGFFESGFEINKIFYGFGLNFMYRYGAYHLPKVEDNISFKFTFYLSLGI
ncbi:DUF5686 family protein [Robertkochia aurantiaca]|uniref:DUF5686 family protein n=1 Tax=Robertkochia aurantiaca TaxID=2873700 RepID=UPI001CCBFC89|nr:DUF5686 family protein [Robertkochia sp. 3YJGBD-33]